MTAGELVRVVTLDRMPPATVVEASETERAALARRFGLPAVHALTARLELSQSDVAIEARGRLSASFEQRCAISDNPFANAIDEPISIRFVPALTAHSEEEEIEFDPDAPDEIEYDGAAIDLGEAVAQSFGLALDPYAEGPEADALRQEVGLGEEDVPSGPFAALAALRKG